MHKNAVMVKTATRKIPKREEEEEELRKVLEDLKKLPEISIE
jgi:hypothetical protein